MVRSLDFHNPKPLIPVTDDSVWPMIRAVERLHWAADHLGAEDMKRLCSRSDYIGEVTPAGIDLFVVHRGCSSCVEGSMPAHSQLDSTRGLSTRVGEMAQGDVFFIETEGAKVPVLLVVCEACLFVYLYVFLESALRSKGARSMVNAREVQGALEGMALLWANAGHPIKALRRALLCQPRSPKVVTVKKRNFEVWRFFPASHVEILENCVYTWISISTSLKRVQTDAGIMRSMRTIAVLIVAKKQWNGT